MSPAPSRIYLAGPDLFAADAAARYARLEDACRARGLEPLRPGDEGVEALRRAHATPREIAARLCEINLAQLRRCDAVLANMAAFRGAIEPDSGTVFEVGFAVALGKPVAVYLPEAGEDLKARLERVAGLAPAPDGQGLVDRLHQQRVEDFGLPLNLMIACSAGVHADAESALDELAQRLQPRAFMP